MVKNGFILLTILLLYTLYIGVIRVAGKTYTEAGRRNSFKIRTALILSAWLTYIVAISFTGIFTNETLPPRIPLLLVLPTFIFFIYFFTNRKFKDVIANTPASWPVYIQVFRVGVELLIWGSVLNGVLPKAASFEGYNYDIVIGITAPIAGYFLIKNGRPKKWMLLAWNVAGLATLAIVVFILISYAYNYRWWGQSESILSKGFGLYPYTFLAGFLMPVAVFMHIFSIIKTLKFKY